MNRNEDLLLWAAAVGLGLIPLVVAMAASDPGKAEGLRDGVAGRTLALELARSGDVIERIAGARCSETWLRLKTGILLDFGLLTGYGMLFFLVGRLLVERHAALGWAVMILGPLAACMDIAENLGMLRSLETMTPAWQHPASIAKWIACGVACLAACALFDRSWFLAIGGLYALAGLLQLWGVAQPARLALAVPVLSLAFLLQTVAWLIPGLREAFLQG